MDFHEANSSLWERRLEAVKVISGMIDHLENIEKMVFDMRCQLSKATVTLLVDDTPKPTVTVAVQVPKKAEPKTKEDTTLDV